MAFSNQTIEIHAPAKINLTLNVTGKREDGYHLLHSLVYFADFGDLITLKPNDTFKFTMESYIEGIPNNDDNLIVKTAKKLAHHYDQNLNCHIHCEKQIPMGAGLGGGSTDAAATAKALFKFWDISPDTEELNKILLSLGADIPVCYHAKPCVFEGIGEIIKPLPNAPELYAVLVHPKQHSSTPTVFKNFEQNFSTKPELKNNENILEFIKSYDNDLTSSAVKSLPVIQEALNTISQTKDCLISRMSGSGSCCFGLYETKEKSQRAEEKIKTENPDWWVKSVVLKGA
jgi:4-diphosphocytidyl-2-C-methyl-D-erythritol kinase